MFDQNIVRKNWKENTIFLDINGGGGVIFP
jgi:hypothetical protein